MDEQEQAVQETAGSEHTDKLIARRDLASSLRQAGRAEQVRALQEGLVADLERLFGADHPATNAARRILEDG